MPDTEPTYSFSRITTFEQCARRFRYRYLDGIKEGFKSVEAFMGQQVHAAIEWLFNERDRGSIHSLEDAVAYYCACWDRDVAGADVLVKVIKERDSIAAQHRLGAELLAAFFRRVFSVDRLATEANEKHFLISLAGGTRFQGFIDRVARDTQGLLYIIDYKTGRQRGKGFAGKDAEQLQSYAVAAFAETDETEIELVIEYLRTQQRVTSRVRREDAEGIERSLLQRIRDLEASTVFPPQPGILCNWCGYNDICDASDLTLSDRRMTG